MKQKVLAMIIMVMPIAAISQISIDHSDMPSAGDTIRTSFSLDPGTTGYQETGNNFTWDFSGLIPFSQTVDSFVTVQQTPLIYQLVFFLSSNLAKKLQQFDQFPGFQLTDTYEFYKNSSSDFRMTGNAATVNGIPVPNKFQNPDIVYKFPIAFGNMDSSTANYNISVPGFGYAGGWKKRVNYADGWGTLITPFGSFQTIRVKSDIIQFDSLYVDTLGIGFPVYRTYTEYKWLGNDFGIPLCSVIEEAMFATIQYIDSVRTITVDISEIRNAEYPLVISPNPSNGQFTLHVPVGSKDPVEISVFDLSGKLNFRKVYPFVPQIPLNLNFLPGGVYVLIVKCGLNLHSQRIMIQ